VRFDSRGFFCETYNRREFTEIGIEKEFVQDNHSRSEKGVLRGLHFQRKHPQGKLVKVFSGTVFDVAVDLRKDSSSYLKWYGKILTEENGEMLYIPEGFAHGFLTLSDKVDFVYKCTDYYYPKYEEGIIWNDKEIGIDWHLKEYGITVPIISDKDRKLPQSKELLSFLSDEEMEI